MKHILLCDDDVTILRAAEIKLTRAGYRVTTYPDGQAALEAIQRELPDMIISDCQMPRMGGLELVRKLREDERTRDVPFLLLTGKGFELPIEDLRRDYGVLGVIGKPFSPREVLQIVETTLAASV
ncbi:MAG: response regulator [Planctomycetales bacterium]|nr:response regulator [Planctomycetales bacterium]MBN8626121.1 response regulator [Planctomycetota bacterium]